MGIAKLSVETERNASLQPKVRQFSFVTTESGPRKCRYQPDDNRRLVANDSRPTGETWRTQFVQRAFEFPRRVLEITSVVSFVRLIARHITRVVLVPHRDRDGVFTFFVFTLETFLAFVHLLEFTLDSLLHRFLLWCFVRCEETRKIKRKSGTPFCCVLQTEKD